MKNQNYKANAFQHKRQGKDTKKEYAKKLFNTLFNEPLSCSRSDRQVEKITTNPELFISNNTNQLNLFE